MTVMVNGRRNLINDGIAVGDADTYEEILGGMEKAFTGKSPEKKLSPIRKAMIEQFGYVSKSLLDKVVI